MSALTLLLAQLDTSYDALSTRLAVLTDEEWRWQPVPAEVPGEPRFDPISFRLRHLTFDCLLGRWDWTFGSKSLTREDRVVDAASAAEALTQLEDAFRKWRAGLDTLTDADLDTVGLSGMPWGWDPKMKFGDTLWWNNRELIHHGAECALLRDLWAHSAR